MFFCEPCRATNRWPESIRQSQGQCECCNVYAVCYDVPSRHLPLPPKMPAPPTSPLEPQVGEPGYVDMITLIDSLTTALSALGWWIDESTHPLGRQFANDNLAKARDVASTLRRRLAGN